MVQTSTYLLAFVPLALRVVVAAAGEPSFAGCLLSYSIPKNALNINGPITARDCATTCLRKEGLANSFFYPSATYPCYCSFEDVPASSYVTSSDFLYGECDSECAANEVTHFTASTSYSRRQLKERSAIAKRKSKAKSSAQCPTPLSACKVSGDSSSYQCIDTNLALESCGGCIDGDFNNDDASDAVDCTALPGVASGGVACRSGKCKAYRCQSGYTLSHHTCVAKSK